LLVLVPSLLVNKDTQESTEMNIYRKLQVTFVSHFCFINPSILLK
jgi:hypothetical protein